MMTWRYDMICFEQIAYLVICQMTTKHVTYSSVANQIQLNLHNLNIHQRNISSKENDKENHISDLSLKADTIHQFVYSAIFLN